jgi:signal transduction histidine kinase
VISNPVLQFLAAALLVLVVIAFGTGRLSARAANEEAVADSRAITRVLAASVAEPALPRGLVTGRPGALDRFDRTVLDRLLVDDVQRIKIWDASGRIVYSDETALIGEQFTLGDEERDVLEHGSTEAEMSDLSRPENRFEAGSGGLLEVYTRILSPEGKPLLFEVYFSAAQVADRKEAVFSAFRPITLGGLALLVVLTTPVLWVLMRRVQAGARARERLLRAAVDASDSERRRIARDLHDGVVQDLAGTSYAVTAVADTLRADRPEASSRLSEAGDSLRTSLRSLRSLLVEIYPPELHTEGLAAALEDLVAQANGAGVEAVVSVRDVDAVDEDVVALVWRVAQEAVRNSLRHGAADRIDVTVDGRGGAVLLEVSDNGRGFEPGAVDATEHFGLRGLRDLIAEAGARLDVRSSPGAGTTVRLEVDVA